MKLKKTVLALLLFCFLSVLSLSVGLAQEVDAAQGERAQRPVRIIQVEGEALAKHEITGSREAQVKIRHSVENAAQMGIRQEASDLRVYKVGGPGNPTFVVVPNMLVLTSVTVEKFADQSSRVNTHYALNPAIVPQAPDNKGNLELSSPYWSEYAWGCPTERNNTGWFTHCFRASVLYNDGNDREDYIALERWGTHKSESHWLMRSAWMDSGYNRNGNPRWYDWDPREDTDRANCEAVEVGVDVDGINLTSVHTRCDKWDITFYPNEPGRFTNTWYGRAWGSEREVAYKTIIAYDQNNAPSPWLSAGFFAIP